MKTINDILNKPTGKRSPIRLIELEIQRQIDVYGYTEQHVINNPSDYDDGQLARCASVYSLPADARTYEWGYNTPDNFVWNDEYWKPTPDDRIKELVKAAAMIAREIERLQSVLTPTA